MKKHRKIPTKAELLQLQKLYKTDERIGERLGGVPAYLVAYWRRKKNIPKYSLPKFSETEIRNLWERYGDDEKAGLELGISKAAFYNWRRRYGFREKPAFLKLEQLELNFPGAKLTSYSSSLYGKRSMAQKILARVAQVEHVEIGNTVEVEPDIALAPGGAGEIVRRFKTKGTEYIWNPNRVVMSLDNMPSDKNDNPAEIHKAVREFSRRQGIKGFYDLREGTCPQLLVEKGHILPGYLALGLGSQSLSYGCMAAMVLNVDPDTMADVWVSGKYSLEVPQTTHVVISGRRYRGVYAVDVALSIINQIGNEAISGKVVEFAGSVISQMTIGERFTLTGLSGKMGALAAVCQYDATTRRYLTGRTMTRFQPILPDKDAEYHELYQINIDQLTPLIQEQGDNEKPHTVVEMEGMTVHQVILGGCTTGRFSDLRVAADVLKGKKVHKDCRMMIIPGSRTVYLEALKKGLIRVFVEAGAIVLNPSCYPGCFTHGGFLAKGERCLTTTILPSSTYDNTKKTNVHLCSPAMAAASALNAAITDPSRYVK